MHSRNIDNMDKMARAMNTSLFVKNGPHLAALGAGGEGWTTMTISTPTGEGVTCARSFVRLRRCCVVDNFRIVFYGGRDWFPSPFLIMDMEMRRKSGRVFLKKSFFFLSGGYPSVFKGFCVYQIPVCGLFGHMHSSKKYSFQLGLGVFSDSSSL